eukprot:1020446-Prorocentrum_minimum.AAC.3
MFVLRVGCCFVFKRGSTTFGQLSLTGIPGVWILVLLRWHEPPVAQYKHSPNGWQEFAVITIGVSYIGDAETIVAVCSRVNWVEGRHLDRPVDRAGVGWEREREWDGRDLGQCPQPAYSCTLLRMVTNLTLPVVTLLLVSEGQIAQQERLPLGSGMLGDLQQIQTGAVSKPPELSYHTKCSLPISPNFRSTCYTVSARSSQADLMSSLAVGFRRS